MAMSILIQQEEIKQVQSKFNFGNIFINIINFTIVIFRQNKHKGTI